MTDKELVQKVHNGNQEALGDIIERYYEDIFRFCLYMVREEEEAYDITQETFLKFIKYKPTATKTKPKTTVVYFVILDFITLPPHK
ncbi:RNA polymerase sigma factor [Blautia hydrogenotrophica]|uniref:RNA polymerase sigma factor n=1 Tax=Blautia hydrogenotrophica TaxID=53443 RepID=UPI003A84EC80